MECHYVYIPALNVQKKCAIRYTEWIIRYPYALQ
jgi:hypothetical protein